MSLIELRFFAFAGLVILLYYVLPKKIQWCVLLAASVVFYLTYGWEKLPYLIFSAFIAYVGATRIDSIQQSGESAAFVRKRSRKVLMWCVVLISALLVYAKIGTWVIQSVSALFSWERGKTMEAVVALGVSYYTFSLISYIADVYWKKDKAEYNFFRLLLFTIYFPKILQGPISRHKNLGAQLREEHKFSYKEFCFGLQLMVWGYFKKMVIADRLQIFISNVFGNPSGNYGSVLLVTALFSCVQIYCDFSGCMDIVGGFSQILGLKLEDNFERPFFSKSAAEFWRRWHITLGTWFKDYVYMPLAISPRLIKISKKLKEKFGARFAKSIMTVVPLVVVWLFTGLWHNVRLSYLVWAGVWGVIIICTNIFAPEIKKLTNFLHIKTDAPSWKAFQTVRTLLLFAATRIITVPNDLDATWTIFGKIFTDFGPAALVDGTLFRHGLDGPNFICALVCILILVCVDTMQEKGAKLREKIASYNIVFRWAVYYIAFFAILIFGIYGPGYDAASFVYMQF